MILKKSFINKQAIKHVATGYILYKIERRNKKSLFIMALNIH